VQSLTGGISITGKCLKRRFLEKEKTMNPITSFIKRYPQATFWAIAWFTWFLGWYLLSLYPSDLWALFMYGPFLTGILVTAIADGRSGLRTYFSRMVRWRVGIQWYAVALFLPPVIRLAAAGLNILSGASMPVNIQLPPWTDLIAGFLFPSFFLVALGEEPGFRGFALPRLLVGRSALSASLTLGVLHAIWHIPVIIFGGDTPLVVVIVISGAVINTWLFNNTNGSVLMAMLLHASIDLMVGIFNPWFTGADAERHVVMQVVVFVAVGVLLPILTGKELGRKPEASMEGMAVDQPLAVQ
jgi:membrane protease YdiL (CAAX protease family)